jgi:hypothetical protein
MKRTSASIILFFIIAGAFTQNLMSDSAHSSGYNGLQPKKINYNVTLGSSFATVSGYGSGLNTYIMPRLSYNVNRHLTIGGGISISQTHYFKTRSYFQNEQSPASDGNFTNATIFIDGQYMVNDRLSVFGSAYKQIPITNDPLPYNPFNPVSSKGAQGFDINVGYRIGKNMYIQAGFRYSEGINPLYPDPFNTNPFQVDSYQPHSAIGIPRW